MPDADQVQNQFAEDVDKNLGLEIQDPGTGRRKPKSERGCLQTFWVPTAIAVVVALILTLWAYSANRPDPGFEMGGTGEPETSGGTSQSSEQSSTKPRRWLIVADTPLYGKRPQFTIELKGDGASGDAVYLEPPQATGTYELSGEDLVVKLVLTQTAAPGVTFPQHIEVRMKKLADGSLTGQLLSENWEYHPDKGLKLKGMTNVAGGG